MRGNTQKYELRKVAGGGVVAVVPLDG